MKKLFWIIAFILAFSFNAYAGKTIGDLTEDTDPTSDDLIETENDPAGTPASRKSTIKNFIMTDALHHYWIDAGEADQGAAGAGKSIKDYVDTIGATEYAVLILSHSGVGDSTTYTLTTNETIGSRIALKIEPGAILDGAGTLTLNGNLICGLKQKCFDADFDIDFGDTSINVVSPEMWGSIASDATGDDTEIQSAVDSIENGEVLFGSGTYITDTSTITVDSIGVTLRGSDGADSWSGDNGTILEAQHSAGPVIKIQRKRCGLKDLTITSNSTRETGAAGTNYGVHVEAADTTFAAARTNSCKFENVMIMLQPSHGFVSIGANWNSLYERLRIIKNYGHGIVFDNGNLTSRTNKDQRPGLFELKNSWLSYNAGHGLLIGSTDTDNWGIRVDIKNVDINRNADNNNMTGYTPAGPDYSSSPRNNAYQAWVRIETGNIELSAFGGITYANVGEGGNNGETSGLYIHHARGLRIINNRLIEVKSPGINIQGDAARTTQGVTVEELYVSQTAPITVGVDFRKFFVSKRYDASCRIGRL
jgi:hypothetical protein